MNRITDQELEALKSRVITAMGSNTFVAKSNDYLLSLIEEVQESRSVQEDDYESHPLGEAKENLHISEMTVTHVGVPKGPIATLIEYLGSEEAYNPSSTPEEDPIIAGEGSHVIDCKVEMEDISTPCGNLEQEEPSEPTPISTEVKEKKVAPKGPKAKTPRH